MANAIMTAPIADEFLGNDYQIPVSVGNGGKYLKFEEGKTVHFRVLSQKALKGYEYWTAENKPVRVLEKPESAPKDIRIEDGKPDRIKHFWAMVVWDYGSSSIKILQITQSTIQGNILGLVRDPDFGHPTKYDLKIARKGKALETEYTVMPLHKPMPSEAMEELKANPVYLDALLTGADPFAALVAPQPTDNLTRLSALRQLTGHTKEQAKTIAASMGLQTKDAKDWSEAEMNNFCYALMADWGMSQNVFRHLKHSVNALNLLIPNASSDTELWKIWVEDVGRRKAELLAAESDDQADAEDQQGLIDENVEEVSNPF